MPIKHDSTYTTIAAQPGWSIAIFGRSMIADGPEEGKIKAGFFYQTIIAWEIEHTVSEYHPAAGQPPGSTHTFRVAVPITADGDHEGDMYAIKGPDGKFLVQAEATFDTEQEAIDYFIEQEQGC